MRATQKKRQVKQFDKLDPEKTPILPSLASLMEVELVSNPEGGVLVIITQDLPSLYWWAEYDVDLKQLYFVTVHAQIQGLGMKIHEVFEKNMIEAHEVKMMYINKATRNVSPVPHIIPLVVRKHTLKD